MAHPLVVALFPTAAAAAAGARAVHTAGVSHDRLSVVSRNHDDQGALARQMDGTPGAEIEDSRPAAVLGELSGYVLAAMALVLPGIGPIVAAGPLAAGLGEAAGHAAGSLASALSHAGIPDDRAEAIQKAVEAGAVLLAVHAAPDNAGPVRSAFEQSGATDVEVGSWNE